MTNPIRAALDKAACAICICEGECFETRHGMMHGPCEKQIDKAAKANSAFLRALPDKYTEGGAAFWDAIPLEEETRLWLADAVLAAARDQPND